MKEIMYSEVEQVQADGTNIPVMLSDETMQERYEKVIKRMEEQEIDTLVVYADVEHGSNFEYLTGFIPRFEEALLVIHKNRVNYMLMGNENLNKVSYARLSATPLHVPYFSLPNQPMENTVDFQTLLQQAEIKEGSKIGLVGWKLFTSAFEDNRTLFDLPYYIVNELYALKPKTLINATSIFIGNRGARCTNNVNELEHYEFGASLASDCILNAMNHLELGMSEMELATYLHAFGQRHSVVTIAAAGKRFVNANLYPTNKVIEHKDPISLTVGYKGGLSSRTGYAINDEKELSKDTSDYLDVVVKPYYRAVVSWLEQVHCNCTGNDVYQWIEQILPKQTYHWELCPGHLSADEEWMSSPIYDGSKEVLESGMIFQLDIIPSIKGYQGTSAESTIALADEALRKKIEEKAPDLWRRIEQRRHYIKEVLHIDIHPDILPMCSTVGYLRPFFLHKEKAMCVKD